MNQQMGVEPKIGGIWSPKMDGENNGSKPYFLMDDLGVPLFSETSKCLRKECNINSGFLNFCQNNLFMSLRGYPKNVESQLPD